jgi:hypothetical protein
MIKAIELMVIMITIRAAARSESVEGHDPLVWHASAVAGSRSAAD